MGHFAYWTVRLLFGHFAYWTVCLLDSLPTRQIDISTTAWTVRLQIAHYAYKTARIKSDV